MAPPIQSLEDFLLTESRWQWPSSRGEDTIFNRFTFNLLYYQINYLLSLIVNFCYAELGFRIELWTGFRQEILPIRRFYGFIPLVISICFHVFLRMPNVKIVDRSIYYERLLKYGFCNKSFRKDETLTSWKQVEQFFNIHIYHQNLDSPSPMFWLEENLILMTNMLKKCSTGQSFIFPKWLVTKSIL